MSDELSRIQRWYSAHCNDDWEHQYGISIETLDNPGWWVKIDLSDTDLQDMPFESVSIDRSDSDWLRLKVEAQVFHGHGGAQNLREILSSFLKWVDPS